MKISGKILLWFLLGFAVLSKAQEATPAPEPKADELETIVKKESDEKAGPTWQTILSAPKGEGALLTVGARFDTLFSMGGAISQGFSIPSVRLTAFGEVSKWIHYRLSAGQTREFASAMLPQLTPVEAYVDIGNERVYDENGLRWRLGMFTPTFNPWWSPDLSDIAFPDYNESHKRLFLSRDIGTELVMGIGKSLTLFVGAFNGNGIYGVNTNSSRAFSGGAKYDFAWGSWKFSLTAATYTAYQSSASSVNYRHNIVGDVSLVAKQANIGLTLGADGMVGVLREYLTSANPVGASFYAEVTLSKGFLLFGRFEYVAKMPTTNFTLNHYQIGPEILLGEHIRGFFLYDYLSAGSGAENTFMGRVRVSL